MRNKSTLIATAIVLVASFSACKSKSNEQAKIDASNFNTYVDSINSIDHVYTQENWQALENGYNERNAKLELEIANLEAEDKTKTEASKAKYAELKASYEQNIANQNLASTMSADSKKMLRDRLFGVGIINSDMQFNFVTPANILSVYETFVKTVKDNKDNYTREDWDEIKVLYEALDTRKNEIEKEMKGADNRKIALLKIEFAKINTFNRSGAKGEENAEAKKMDK